MRKSLFFAATLAVCLVGLIGCSAQDGLDLKPFTTTWPTVGPEYRAFLNGTPPALMTAEDKQDKIRARIMLCDELDAIVARRAGK
jgi:hypothetical protein